MKEYSYTSTPSMGRTACTEPQCLYKDDLYLYLEYNMTKTLPAQNLIAIVAILDNIKKNRKKINKNCTDLINCWYRSPSAFRTIWEEGWSGINGNPDQRAGNPVIHVTYKKSSLSPKA